MPVPPRTSTQYACAHCDWRGPPVSSDVLLPLACPVCGHKAVLKPMTTASVLGQLVKQLLR